MSLLSTSSSSSSSTSSQQVISSQAQNSNENENTTTNTPTTTTQISSSQQHNRLGPLILQAPQPSDILFFNESLFDSTSSPMMLNSSSSAKQLQQTSNSPQTPPSQQYPRPIVKKSASAISITGSTASGGKRVRFPEEGDMRQYSEAPKRGWHPGKHSTSDLLDAYIRACDKHKCKPLAKLVQQLKALQDLDCANGEKVNVLNLKSEKLDSKQVEALEEVFKRLSFKTIDLEATQFEDDTTGSTLFEILDYYDTCERLTLANVKGMGLYGWQELAKYCRKTISLENLDIRGATYTEFIYFTYLARSFRLTQSLRVLHLENSSMSGRLLIMLAAAMRDNEQIRELHLAENKLAASTDGAMLASIIKEARALELLDLRGNTSLGDLGLSYVCSALSVEHVRLKHLVMANCGLTQAGVPYLCKALVQNHSLVTLNIGANSLTNESIFELKQALLANRHLETLYLNKSKLSDEGCVALAEYIAETRTLKRLDLRDNDIRLGGLMALASSLKFNSTLEQVDLDREPKREQSIRDSVETSKRLLADINEFCVRNKRNQAERDRLRQEQQKLEETIQEEEKEASLSLTTETSPEAVNNNNNINNTNNNEENGDTNTAVVTTQPNPTVTESNSKETEITNEVESSSSSMETTTTTTTSTTEEDETAIDVIAKDDELLKRILHRTFSPAPNLHSPITPVDLPNAYFAQFAIKDLAEATRTESDDMATEDDDGDDSKSSTLPTTTSSSSPHLFHNNTDLNHSCASETKGEIIESNHNESTSNLDPEVIALVDELLNRIVDESTTEKTNNDEDLIENSDVETKTTNLPNGDESMEIEEEKEKKNNEDEEENIDMDSDSDIEVLPAAPNSPPSPDVTRESEQRAPVMPPTPELTPKATGDRSAVQHQTTPVKATSDATQPFFDSRLTNSQLTEELSHEIGLFN